VGLVVNDDAGQLQIRWDNAAEAVRNARLATLDINDGNNKTVVPMDGVRLSAGAFAYARQSETVDVRLTIQDAAGNSIHEAASFFGAMPEKRAEDPAVVRQRDELAREAVRLKAELEAQSERTRKLERSMEEMRQQLKRDEQRRRLENQNPGAGR